MGRLTNNFTREEFACSCGCGFDTIDYKLIEILQKLRSDLGAKISVTSGCRCPEKNASVGGSPTSQHMKGKAADFVVEGYSPREIYDLLDRWFPDQYGLRAYKTWVHFDVRDGVYRK